MSNPAGQSRGRDSRHAQAQYDASSWLEPIIEPDRWERLTEMLTDPARRTNPHNANAPRWLLSGHAWCGICADGSTEAFSSCLCLAGLQYVDGFGELPSSTR